MFLLLKILVILTFHILSHPLKVLQDGETLKDQVVTLICTHTHTFVHIYTHTQDNYYNPPPGTYALGLIRYNRHTCEYYDLGESDTSMCVTTVDYG